jgi:hypothetical protein
MEMDEVFEARIISGRQTRSISRKSSDFISNFSVAASTTKSQSAGFFFGRDFVLYNFAVEVLTNRRHAPIDESLFHIAQHYVVPGAGKDVRDTIAHCSRANHAHAFDIHETSIQSENWKV